MASGNGRPAEAGPRREGLIRLVDGLSLVRRVGCPYLSLTRRLTAVARTGRRGRTHRALLSRMRGGIEWRFAVARVHCPLVNRITTTARHGTMKR